MTAEQQEPTRQEGRQDGPIQETAAQDSHPSDTDVSGESEASLEATAEATVDSEMLDLQFALRDAEADLLAQREAVLRMQAEMENLRKRLVRDLERSRKLALEKVMADLLPVRDSLERGLEAAGGESATVEALREGKQLTMKLLNKVLEDHGLVEINPDGQAFNPELHEAISMLPSAELVANTVVAVVQKGYQLHERLIRPARVVVSSGSPGN